jgi:hypothetical protein
MSIHAMLQGATSIPELAIQEDEARKMAECAARVAAFYTGSVSPKMQAWTALLLAVGGIYGSRAVAYVLRTRIEAEQRMTAAREAAANDPRRVPLVGM